MIRVVVADDHPFLRAGLRSVLADTEFVVVAEATDGARALHAIAEQDPDIVLLDISMQPLDGIAVLEQLRATGDQRAVVLLTASISDDQLLRAIRCGANGIVMKDGAEEVLLDSLRAVSAGRSAVERKLLERGLALRLATNSRENGLARLNAKERSIARCISAGMRNREIAEETGLSEGTVKVYLYHIYNKLEVSNRTELALYIRNHGEAG